MWSIQMEVLRNLSRLVDAMGARELSDEELELLKALRPEIEDLQQKLQDVHARAVAAAE